MNSCDFFGGSTPAPRVAQRAWHGPARRAWRAGLLLIGAAFAHAAPADCALLLVSVDGLRPDYVLEANRHGLKVPHLRGIVREGAFATAVRGVLPTSTYPSHTTIITGVAPTHPEMGATFLISGDGLRANYSLGRIDMRSIAPTLAAYLGVPFPSADVPGHAIFSESPRRSR